MQIFIITILIVLNILLIIIIISSRFSVFRGTNAPSMVTSRFAAGFASYYLTYYN